MRRSAGRLEDRRAERTATSERGSTSGRNRERDDNYRETSRRDDREKSTSTSTSSGRRTGITDVNPIPKSKNDPKYQEWVNREARRRAGGEKDLIDSCADKIMREQEKNKLKGRPEWDWSGQKKKDWCKKESAGDPDLERKLWDKYR